MTRFGNRHYNDTNVETIILSQVWSSVLRTFSIIPS